MKLWIPGESFDEILELRRGLFSDAGEGGDANNQASGDTGSANQGGSATSDSDGAAGADAGASADAGEGQADGQRPAPQARKDWKDGRIGQLTARNHAIQAELAAARAELEKLRGGTPGAEGTGAASAAPPDVEQLAQLRAEQIAQQRIFNDACNRVFESGTAEHGAEFGQRVNAIRELVNPADPKEAAAYQQFLNAVIETGESAAGVIFKLGGDREEAHRIMSLSPTRMAMEIGRLAAPTRSADGASVSGAPKPIRPVAGGRQAPHTAVEPDDPERADNLSSAEWFRRREAQIAARGARR